MLLKFYVNSQKVEIEVDATRRLIDILREDLELTGTKEGCGEGECGACTVIMNGKPVYSCLLVAAQLNDSDIISIEGLAAKGNLSPLQQAFIEEGAIQCGFCTAGMIMTSYALLLDNAHPTDEEIKKALAGNLCRCSGYEQIIRAVKKAAGIL